MIMQFEIFAKFGQVEAKGKGKKVSNFEIFFYLVSKITVQVWRLLLSKCYVMILKTVLFYSQYVQLDPVIHPAAIGHSFL